MPTSWGTSEEHLGRRKPEGALVLADARGRVDEWRQLLQSLRERLEQARGGLDASGTNVPIGTIVPVSPPDLRRPDALAFVAPALAARARALVLAAPLPGAPLRLCSSLLPDAVRAALAGLGDLTRSTAWIADGDGPRGALVRALGIARVERLPADASGSIFSAAPLALAQLLGADVPRALSLAAAALEEFEREPPEECGPFRLGALLAGFAARGMASPGLTGPDPLRPLLAWIESAAARLPARDHLALFDAGPLAEPEVYGPDRWLLQYRLGPAPEAPHPHDPASRARRLIGAGAPLLQLALPSLEAVPGELVRWELALGLAGRCDLGAPLTPAPLDAIAEPLEPALREGPLSLRAATDTHAYILRKVAGTLGKSAESSLHHWLAAQLAMGEGGDFISLHWLALPTPSSLAALRELQATLRGPHRLPVRVSLALPEASGETLLAGGSSRGLFFLVSDGGGAELCGLRARALEQQVRALALLGAAGRRALLVRSEDGGAETLLGALRAAGALLA